MIDDRWLDNWKDLLTAQASAPALLELGCGSGRDTRQLARLGFADITATDLSRASLAACAHAVPSAHLVCHDLRQPLPFADKRFDAVVASLCLHYFPWDATAGIVRNIRRCLVSGGVLLCRVNSTRDIHYGASGHPEIARHYYDVDGTPKRFFDAADLDALFAAEWECLYKAERTIDRYEKPKTVWETVLRKR